MTFRTFLLPVASTKSVAPVATKSSERLCRGSASHDTGLTIAANVVVLSASARLVVPSAGIGEIRGDFPTGAGSRSASYKKQDLETSRSSRFDTVMAGGAVEALTRNVLCPENRIAAAVLGTLYRSFVLLLGLPLPTGPAGKRARGNSETGDLVGDVDAMGLHHSAPPREPLAPDRERAEGAGARFADREGQRLARGVPDEVRVERAEVHRGCRAKPANERQAHVLGGRVLGGHRDHLAHERLKLGEGLLVVEMRDRHVEDSSSWAVPGSAAWRRPPVPTVVGVASRPSFLSQPASVRIAGGRTTRSRPGSAGFYGCRLDSAGDVRSVRSLECVECGRVSEGHERGWTARLTVHDQVVVYCM